MKKILLNAIVYDKNSVTLALESGVDGLIVPDAESESVAAMARCTVLPASKVQMITLSSKVDESVALEALRSGATVLLPRGWEVIPVENLLAHGQNIGRQAGAPCSGGQPEITAAEAAKGTSKEISRPVQFGRLILEVGSVEEAQLAAGILESGVDTIALAPEAVDSIKDIVAKLKSGMGRLELSEAVISEITPVALGHRVCVDTTSLLKNGQGMLVGNSAAFTFLVNAETEYNEFVAPRPFRINAGAVHAYTLLPEDRTAYLDELAPGTQVLIVDHEGNTESAVAGRLKVEKRPLLMLKAKAGKREGTVFLQNAETIRLVQPGGASKSVVALQAGDKVLCHLDNAGRHFGVRIKEDISEA